MGWGEGRGTPLAADRAELALGEEAGMLTSSQTENSCKQEEGLGTRDEDRLEPRPGGQRGWAGRWGGRWDRGLRPPRPPVAGTAGSSQMALGRWEETKMGTEGLGVGRRALDSVARKQKAERWIPADPRSDSARC